MFGLIILFLYQSRDQADTCLINGTPYFSWKLDNIYFIYIVYFFDGNYAMEGKRCNFSFASFT